jgi:hypothetical protein
MLGHSIFYYHTVRKMVVAFGSLFQDIYIERQKKDGTDVEKHILVPLSYAPKQKWLNRILQNPKLESGNVAIDLPRMSFILDSLVYNPDRKLQSTVYNESQISPQEKLKQYVPVPYDYNFSFFILTDNYDDGLQVIEQVLPFFKPEFTVTVNTIPELGIANDVPVVLNSTTIDDNYETGFEDKRLIVWTLGFVMQGWIYGPISEQGVIKRVYEEIRIPPGGTGPCITPDQILNTPKSVEIITEVDPLTAGPDDPHTIKVTIDEIYD